MEVPSPLQAQRAPAIDILANTDHFALCIRFDLPLVFSTDAYGAAAIWSSGGECRHLALESEPLLHGVQLGEPRRDLRARPADVRLVGQPPSDYRRGAAS